MEKCQNKLDSYKQILREEYGKDSDFEISNDEILEHILFHIEQNSNLTEEYNNVFFPCKYNQNIFNDINKLYHFYKFYKSKSKNKNKYKNKYKNKSKYIPNISTIDEDGIEEDDMNDVLNYAPNEVDDKQVDEAIANFIEENDNKENKSPPNQDGGKRRRKSKSRKQRRVRGRGCGHQTRKHTKK